MAIIKIGIKFNDWTIIGYEKNKINRTIYKCQCKCGSFSIITKDNLKRNRSTCCKKCSDIKRADDNSMIGKQFGDYLIIERDLSTNTGGAHYQCKCLLCNKIYKIRGSKLRNGKTHSCKSCSNKKRLTHGLTNTPTYSIWAGIKDRCYRKNHKSYKWYGGKGIKMSNEWFNSFESFLKDMGERPDKMEVDRIDSNKDYCKENCRWVTKKENLKSMIKTKKDNI